MNPDALTRTLGFEISRPWPLRGRFGTRVETLKRKGASVALERPEASDVTAPSTGDRRDFTRPGDRVLTRAQTRALGRCAPLTPAEFKAKRQLAARGISPLRHR
jgi:hypothetical protein